MQYGLCLGLDSNRGSTRQTFPLLRLCRFDKNQSKSMHPVSMLVVVLMVTCSPLNLDQIRYLYSFASNTYQGCLVTLQVISLNRLAICGISQLQRDIFRRQRDDRDVQLERYPYLLPHPSLIWMKCPYVRAPRLYPLAMLHLLVESAVAF